MMPNQVPPSLDCRWHIPFTGSPARLSTSIQLVLLIVLWAATGCDRPAPHDKVANAITEEFAYRYVRPLSDPVARLAHNGEDIPSALLLSNRVTLVELIPQKGERRTLFEDETRRPPNDGMITGVDNAHDIGLFYPAALNQSDIEVRVNYSCDLGDDSVAVHLVVPNPLTLKKKP